MMLTIDRCGCRVANNTISHVQDCKNSEKIIVVDDVVQKIFSYLVTGELLKTSLVNKLFCKAGKIQIERRKVSELPIFIDELIDCGALAKLRQLGPKCQLLIKDILKGKFTTPTGLNAWLKSILLFPEDFNEQGLNGYLQCSHCQYEEPLKNYQWIDFVTVDEKNALADKIRTILPFRQADLDVKTFRSQYVCVRLLGLLKKMPPNENNDKFLSLENIKVISSKLLIVPDWKPFPITELVRGNLELVYPDSLKKQAFFKTCRARLPLMFEVVSYKNLFIDRTAGRFDKLEYNFVIKKLIKKLEDGTHAIREEESLAVREWLELLNEFHPWPIHLTNYFIGLYRSALSSQELLVAFEVISWIFLCHKTRLNSDEFYVDILEDLPLPILISEKGQGIFFKIPEVQRESVCFKLVRKMLLEQFNQTDLVLAEPILNFKRPKLFSNFSELKFLYDQLSLKERLSTFEELILLVDRLKDQIQHVYQSSLVEEHLYWILRLLNSEEQPQVLQRLDPKLRLVLQNRMQRETSIFPETYSEADIISYYQEQEAKRANVSLNQEGPTTPRLSLSNMAYLDEDEFYSDIEEMADIENNSDVESNCSDIDDFVENSDEASDD